MYPLFIVAVTVQLAPALNVPAPETVPPAVGFLVSVSVYVILFTVSVALFDVTVPAAFVTTQR